MLATFKKTVLGTINFPQEDSCTLIPLQIWGTDKAAAGKLLCTVSHTESRADD